MATLDLWCDLPDHTALARMMKLRKLSVRALAAECGVHRSTIGHLRSGKVRTCSPETAAAIEDALGITPQLIFFARSVRRNAAA